jgi:polyferredoxin
MDEPKPSKTWLLIFPSVSFLLLSAHFLRLGNKGLFLIALSSSLLVYLKPPYIRFILSIVLLAGFPLWLRTAYEIAEARMSAGRPFVRAVIIIAAVALFTLFSSWAAFKKSRFASTSENWLAVLTFIFSLSLLSIVMIKKPQMILLERFFDGGGEVQVFLASFFGSVVSVKLWDLKDHAKWRLRFWLAFSIFFYLQLLMGMFGEKIFLVTGKLHIPIPAMVIAGPVYRGEGFFMPILFVATILLVGPAWCSHLCYFGAWDNLATSNKKKPDEKPGLFSWVRIFSLLTIVGTAALLRFAGVSMSPAAVLGISFGVLSIIIVLIYSRRSGLMVNCTALCPLGLLANIFGKVSPFRIRIETTCVDCMACFKVCRYGALPKEDIVKRRAGFTCSLCGDCIISCPKSSIHYSFIKLKPAVSRYLFVFLSSSLYATFFAVAMV